MCFSLTVITWLGNNEKIAYVMDPCTVPDSDLLSWPDSEALGQSLTVGLVVIRILVQTGNSIAGKPNKAGNSGGNSNEST